MKQYLIALIVIFAGGLLGNVLRYNEKMPEQFADFGLIPLSEKNYSGSEHLLADYEYEVLKADTTTLRDYISGDNSTIQLFIAYFKSQKYGGQIHSPKNCLPGGGWRIESVQPFAIQIPGGDELIVNRMIIAYRNYRSVMLYWYETRSGSIRNEYGLKLDLIKNALLFMPTDAAIVRLTVNVSEGETGPATEKLVRFVRQFYPHIEKSLPF